MYRKTNLRTRHYRIWDVRKLQGIAAELSDHIPPAPTASPGDSTENDVNPLEFDAVTVSEFVESKKGKGTLRAEWRHDKSVSSAYWDPRGRGIVSTSYDDTLRSVCPSLRPSIDY